MNKKSIFIISIISIIYISIFIIPSTTAAISTSGRQMYFNFTDNMKNEWKPENAWNCTGVDFTGQGADFEATQNDYCEYTVDKTLITALADYTFCLKFRPESVSAAMYIWDEFGSNYGNLYRIRDPGTGFYKFNSRHNADNTDTTTTIAANTNYTTCTIWKDVTNTGELLLDDANESALDTQYTASDDTYQIEIGAIKENFGARSGYYDGIIYEICIWNRSLTASELTEVKNYGCEGATEAPPAGNQTPTPTGLINTSNGYTNITLSWNQTYKNYGYFIDNINSTASSVDRKFADSFTINSTGRIYNLYSRLKLESAGTTQAKAFVYSNNASNLPGTLLATSNEITITNTDEQAIEFNFTGSQNITLTTGTIYWFGVHINDPGAMNYLRSRDIISNGHISLTDTYEDGLGGWDGVGLVTGNLDIYIKLIQSNTKYLIFRNGTNVANDTAPPYTDTGLNNHTRYGYQLKYYNPDYTTPLSAFSTKLETWTDQTIAASPSVNVTLYSPLNNSVNQSINANFTIGLISSVSANYTMKIYQSWENLSTNTGVTLGYSVAYDPLNKTVWMGNWTDGLPYPTHLEEYDAYTMVKTGGVLDQPWATEDCAYDPFRDYFVCMMNPNGTIKRMTRYGETLTELAIGVSGAKQGIDVNSDGNYTVCVDTTRYKFDSDTGTQISTGSISGGCSCDGLTVQYDKYGKDVGYWLSCDNFGIVAYNAAWSATGYQIPLPDALGVEGIDFHENQCTLYITYDDHAPGVSNGWYRKNVCDPIVMNVTKSVPASTMTKFTNTWDDLLYDTAYDWYYKYNSSSSGTVTSLPYTFSTEEYVPIIPTPIASLKTNIINYENYTSGTFVFKFNATTTDVTNYSFYCKLWAPYNIKDIGDKWITDIRVNNNITFDTALYQSPYAGSYTPLNLTCQNNEFSLGNLMISRAVWIDSTDPTITYTGLNNNVYYRGVNTMLPYVFTYSDDNLYLINTSLCASSSGTTCTQQISNWVSTSLTDDTRLVNVTNLLTGLPEAYNRYFIFAQAWDGHTAAAIDDYKLKDISTGTRKGVKVNDGVEISSPDAKSLTFKKNTDRYSFDLERKTPTDTDITFYLKSNGNLTYNPHSEYLGHFIDFENRKWIDFETENADSVSFVKVSDKEYQVTVHMKPAKKGTELTPITFNSIGDLNYVSKYVYFNISNSSLIRAKDRITGSDIQNITVKVYTYPNTLIQTKSTTNYNVSLNITSGTYYLNISGNAGGVNYITNMTPNQTFTQNLDKLVYLSLANSLYLIVYDEKTDELIDDRNVTIQLINYANISTVYSTETGSTFLSDFAAGFYEINYLANNYTANSYYTTISGGDTQTIRLYLLSDLDATHQYLNYDIVDDSAAPISNATLKMQRYYIGNGTIGTWRTVEMSISNDQGKGFVFAELYDATYRFIIEYPFGTTKKITSQTKLDARDLFFNINLIDIGLTNYYQAGDVATTLVYSNTTKVLTYSFNAASLDDVSAGRFLVTKNTGLAKTTICNTTVSASSGGMTCNLTAYSTDDSTFIAQGFVTFASDSLEYLVEASSLTLTNAHLKYGFNGLYLSMVVVGTMALIGAFSPVGAIIMGLFGMVITNMLGLVALNYSWLIGLIIVGLIFIYSGRR